MARWHSCNVLHQAEASRQLWQFASGGKQFALTHQESKHPSEPLPPKLVGKDWQTIFKPRLNIAWLPADKAFLRVAHLPKAELSETQSMLDLQMEKLSPLPVGQIVWGFEVLPFTDPELQTVVVIIAARSHVEEFLSGLENQGYQADRLELPFLDQLRAAPATEDGVWIYPGAAGDEHSCLVAWWYGGLLRNLSLLRLPQGENRRELFQSQLAQMAWAGELEGWLSGEPRCHIVAERDAADTWKGYLSDTHAAALSEPLPNPELAALTARRVIADSLHTNLVPAEHLARYRQQFIDRLWMRGLGAVLMVYLFAALIYLAWVQIARFRYESVESDIVSQSVTYTNTLQLKERIRVVREQLDLQFAALDCWKAVADNLPTELTLDNLNFDRGRTVTLIGLAPSDAAKVVQDFNDAVRKATAKGQPLFSKVDSPKMSQMPGGAQLRWSFNCDLKRTDVE